MKQEDNRQSLRQQNNEKYLQVINILLKSAHSIEHIQKLQSLAREARMRILDDIREDKEMST